MADNAWSQSTCRADVWWYGVPGSGCWYWTQRFGQYWVSGGLYQTYADNGWECPWGGLGPPVKSYQWLSEFSAYGQWFESGAIYYRDGHWQIWKGDMGQTAGRDMDIFEAPENAESPPDSELPVEVERPAPPSPKTESS